MNHRALLQGGPQCPVQAVFEVQLAAPFDDMGEQVTVERRVLREQRVEVKRPLRRDEFVQAYLARRQVRPHSERGAVVGIWAPLPDPLEDHPRILDPRR